MSEERVTREAKNMRDALRESFSEHREHFEDGLDCLEENFEKEKTWKKTKRD